MTKNKLKIILIIIISILILGLITTIIIKNNTDSNKFKREYEAYNNIPLTQEKGNYIKLNIQKNNQIKYLNDDNIIKEIQKGNKIIYMGFPDCNWCRMILPVLLNAANENGIKEIYYYNFKNIRNDYYQGKTTNKAKTYEKLIKILDKNIETTFEDGKNKGKKKLTAPTVLLVNQGKITNIHQGAVPTHKDYTTNLNKKEQEELFKVYEDMMIELLLCDENCKD